MLTAIERIDTLARAIGADVGLLIKDRSPSASNQIATKLTLLEQAWKSGFAEILSTQSALQLALAEVKTAQKVQATTAVANVGSSTTPATSIVPGSNLPANFVFGHNGIHRGTGKGLSGWLHCAQSIRDILSTPIGSRVMRRDYGSRIPGLIDRPMTQDTLFECTAAAAEALETWEPRFRLKLLTLNAASGDGRMEITIKGTYYPRGHLGDFTLIEDYGDLLIRV